MNLSRPSRGLSPALAAMVAAGTALPALWLPFLSDDWAHLADAAQSPTLRTPFGYFRPLAMTTYWLDRMIGGLSPSLFHLTNLLLISAAAALAVMLIRRYTGDEALACTAGVLFALHPYHVECAAWIAARTDPLFTVLFLSAALAYDRWRTRLKALPVAALLLFEGALLAKETAVSLPAFLLVLGLGDRSRRPRPPEWLRGYLPVAGLAMAHFLIIRPAALGGAGLSVLNGFGVGWIKNLLRFATSSVLPAHSESLEGRPVLWGALAVLDTCTLAFLARRRSGRIPSHAWAAVPAFIVLLGPSLISFQERYLFLPSAASALALAALLKAAGARVRALALTILVPGWLLSSYAHWDGWFDAGRAGTRLVGDLVQASLRPEVQEIVVANMPHRVHGAPVAANFAAAVTLSGGRPVGVRYATAIDYPGPRADALDGPPGAAIRYPPPFAEIRLRLHEEKFSRLVRPLPPAAGSRLETDWGSIDFDGARGLRVRIAPSAARDRAAYVWIGGKLEPLF